MTPRSLAAALILSISPVIVAQQMSSQPGQGRSGLQ
jgi:hypothetical protein